jgi:hypothetical protein
MNNIEEVCEKLLDNADLQVNLSSFPDVLLNFVVIGKVNSYYWEVVFELISVTQLSISKEHEEEYTSFDEYLVLLASVKELEVEGKKSFIVNIGHDSEFNFSANCVNFKWSAIPYTEEEFRKRNSYMFAKS